MNKYFTIELCKNIVQQTSTLKFTPPYELAHGFPSFLILAHRISLLLDDENLQIETDDLAFYMLQSADLSLNSLYAGLPGLLWAVDKIQISSRTRRLFDSLQTSLDEELTTALNEQRVESFDLIWGTVGIAVYALDRILGSRNEKLLQAVTRNMFSQATCVDGVSLWKTRYKRSGDEDGQQPDPLIDLGLAHGNAGVISVLAHMASVLGDQKLIDSIHASAKWLASSRLSPGAISQFPNNFGETEPSRLGWCYGDLSVAIALFKAGIATGDDDLCALAATTIDGSMVRTAEGGFVGDIALCHGSLGIALIFKILSRRFARPDWENVAFRWTRQGLAGCRDVNTFIDNFSGRGGFLSGASGAGLALLDLFDVDRVPWHGAMLLDFA